MKIKMKMWLKGGLIGLGIGVVLDLIVYIPGIEGLGMIPMIIISLPLLFLVTRSPLHFPAGDSYGFLLLGLSFILSPITCFILGAIIGLIIKKLKERKQNQTK